MYNNRQSLRKARAARTQRIAHPYTHEDMQNEEEEEEEWLWSTKHTIAEAMRAGNKFSPQQNGMLMRWWWPTVVAYLLLDRIQHVENLLLFALSLSLSLSVSPSLHLSVYPSIRLSVSLTLCLSVSPSLSRCIQLGLVWPTSLRWGLLWRANMHAVSSTPTYPATRCLDDERHFTQILEYATASSPRPLQIPKAPGQGTVTRGIDNYVEKKIQIRSHVEVVEEVEYKIRNVERPIHIPKFQNCEY